MEKHDLIIIGSGASGLACAIEAKRRGLSFQIIERGALVNAIYRYPTNMIFFTTADLLEIGDIPLICSGPKPTRLDALRYYRRVVDHYELPVRLYEEVLSVEGQLRDFRLETRDRLGVERTYHADRVIVSVGYYDNPNLMNIPGEDLPKVSHYYSEPHPYWGKKVAVIGGKNSAVEAALELYRAGIDVTLIYRGPELRKHIKYWIVPDINNRIDRGEIPAYLSTEVVEIRERELVLETPEGRKVLENDFVLAMTGYHPDHRFLRSMGIELDPDTLEPDCDPETLESNVPGLYVAGAIVAGRMTNRIFIENGRFHGGQIFRHWPVDEPEKSVGLLSASHAACRHRRPAERRQVVPVQPTHPESPGPGR